MNMTEEIMDVIDLPFVHYVFAALDEEKLKEFEKLTEGIESKIYEAVEQEDWEFRLTPDAGSTTAPIFPMLSMNLTTRIKKA